MSDIKDIEVRAGDEAVKCFSTEERGQRLRNTAMLISDADGIEESGGKPFFHVHSKRVGHYK